MSAAICVDCHDGKHHACIGTALAEIGARLLEVACRCDVAGHHPATETPAAAAAVPDGLSTRQEVAAVETLTPAATETPVTDAGASPIHVMALAAVFIVGVVVAPFAAQPPANSADLVFWVCFLILVLAGARALKLPSTDAPETASPVPSPVTGQQVPAPQAGTIQQVAASSPSDAATTCREGGVR